MKTSIANMWQSSFTNVQHFFITIKNAKLEKDNSIVSYNVANLSSNVPTKPAAAKIKYNTLIPTEYKCIMYTECPA